MTPSNLARVLRRGAVLSLSHGLLQVLVRHFESRLAAMNGQVDAVRFAGVPVIGSAETIERSGVREVAKHRRIKIAIRAAARCIESQGTALPSVRSGDESRLRIKDSASQFRRSMESRKKIARRRYFDDAPKLASILRR